MVVGTVIDPDMRDELRVTVVATGLGGQIKKEEPAMKLVHRNQNGEVDYEKLERPTVIRKQAASDRMASAVGHDANLDYLDIPAFLRRQSRLTGFGGPPSWVETVRQARARHRHGACPEARRALTSRLDDCCRLRSGKSFPQPKGACAGVRRRAHGLP